MNFIKYVRKNGIRRTINVLWRYKIEMLFEKIVLKITKNKKLKNIIVIESHNDFDCNGGAFYNYLIKNNYNKKYKIIWLVRKKYKKKLPENVKCVQLYKPSLKKAYYMCMSKFFSYDCDVMPKLRDDQIVVFCSHGAGGLKNVKNNMRIPENINYILGQSKEYATIGAEQLSISPDDKRLVSIGYPSQDVFYDNDYEEIKKVTKRKFKKVILWMPTFRKGGGYNRNDSIKEQKLGIPLIQSIDSYNYMNNILKELDILLIIKIHPKQNLEDLKIGDLSNIIVLTGEKVKTINVDNYKLMKCTDALISDYSSATYDYLQLDKPIAYVLDDMNEYKLGFVVEDIHQLIAGQEIYNMEDMVKFIKDVSNDNDIYREKRRKIRDYIYDYHDGNSCERLTKLFGL